MWNLVRIFIPQYVIPFCPTFLHGDVISQGSSWKAIERCRMLTSEVTSASPLAFALLFTSAVTRSQLALSMQRSMPVLHNCFFSSRLHGQELFRCCRVTKRPVAALVFRRVYSFAQVCLMRYSQSVSHAHLSTGEVERPGTYPDILLLLRRTDLGQNVGHNLPTVTHRCLQKHLHHRDVWLETLPPPSRFTFESLRRQCSGNPTDTSSFAGFGNRFCRRFPFATLPAPFSVVVERDRPFPCFIVSEIVRLIARQINGSIRSQMSG